ncbi:MAG: putative methyltransferase [Parcubacteria group bacterium Licking1014_1]|nr:MAG: putative methyltransferase [Parcubacteria group bacterium Licking1014_1]
MEYSNVIDLFREATRQYTIEEIANILGLHKGTILRWSQNKEVPNNYKADFLRMLGFESNEYSSIKEKDQYYTKSEIAQKCFLKFKEVSLNLNIDLDNYHFIEPSAGNGRFYELLPENKKTGIDIDPKAEGIIKHDYLKWFPNKDGKYIVIGNPPFGLRGHLALQFINHSYKFADLVAFILPQLFNSDGKGSTRKRVVGYKLAYAETLPPDSFEYPNGEEIEIHTIFQIWTKINTDKISLSERKTCSHFITVYSLSDGGKPSNTRNKKMIGKCDVYLPSTTYSGMKAYDSFYDLPHRRGYGVVINRNKTEIKKILKNNDWNKTAFSSSNSAVNLRTSLIEGVVINRGYVDKKLNLWK